MIYVSIDPGIGCLGWASWHYDPAQAEHPVLLACGGITIPVAKRRQLDAMCEYAAEHLIGRGDVGHVFVEQMPFGGDRDTGRAGTKKAIELLKLQAIGAFVAGRLGGQLHYAMPGTWKGSTAKKHTEARAAKQLSLAERTAFYVGTERLRPSLRHNVWDAVGIGLWGLGRYVVRAGTAPRVR